MAANYKRQLPSGTKRIATGCQYCAVGCGYNAFLIPDGVTETKEYDGVARFITPAMRNRVRFRGIPHDVAVAPDVLCDLNKGNHSVRGGSQGFNLVTHDRKGESTKQRLTAPMIRLKSGDWEPITWTQLNQLLGQLVVGAGQLKWDESKQKLRVGRPEAIGAKVFEYQYLENTYAFSKLFYSALGTPNVAYHDRPSAAGSSPGLNDAGLRPHSFSYEEVSESDVLVFIGTNPYENQSVFFMQYAVGKEMVVVDPRRTATANYAIETNGLHVQLPKLGIDSLLLYGVAREILVRWKSQHGSLDNYPWRNKIAQAPRQDWTARRKSRALTFDEFVQFLDVGNPQSTYALENIANKHFTPEEAPERLRVMRDFTDRIYPVKADGTPRKVGLIYEKGMIWGFNYHNTAAAASLGLLLGANSEPGRFLGRVGGHQKGWATSKADLGDDFLNLPGSAATYSAGYPFHNSTDEYTDSPADREAVTFKVHHNLDHHVFGVNGPQTTDDFVTLENGLRTKSDPDVNLLFIIGGNYLGQTNDAQAKRKKFQERLKLGGNGKVVARPTKSQLSDLSAVADIYLDRMTQGGIVAVHQEIFENPTSAFCDILIPAAGWGEDDFCRYNAQRRLKIYSRFQDSPLHPEDLERIQEFAGNDKSKLDPFLYRDTDDNETNTNIYRYSPKSDWMIFRDLGRAIIREVVRTSPSTAQEIIDRTFSWQNSADVADEMAVFSNRGLAGADKKTGESMLGDLFLFGRDTLGLTIGSGILHEILGAGQPEAQARRLHEQNYSVTDEAGQRLTRIHGNQVATNGVLLKACGVDASCNVVTVKPDLSGSLATIGSNRGQQIKSIRGSQRWPLAPPYSFVRADWSDIEATFHAINNRANDELFITNGRFNHLWNNMFHHLRNEYINERYPEDMPGTILEVNPEWAEGKFDNGDTVKVNDGQNQFTAVISLQDSVPNGGAFAMFSYPVRKEDEFGFDGYVNNLTHGYADAINPIAALKYGKAKVSKTGTYQSTTRRGPTFEQRNRIQMPPSPVANRLDWEMRELVVKKGLPRAFRHSTPNGANVFLHKPDAMLDYLREAFGSQPEEFRRLLTQAMKWPFGGFPPEAPLIDEWQPSEIELAMTWLSQFPPDGSPGTGDDAEAAMLTLLRTKQAVAIAVHDAIPVSGGDLASLFAEDSDAAYRKILDFLKTGTAIRKPHIGLPLVVPGDPDESAFYLHTAPGGVMDSQFSASEQRTIVNWITSLDNSTTPPTPGETMSSFDQVKQILDDAVSSRPNFGAHGPFWRTQTRDEFVAFQFAGISLVTLHDGPGSGIIKALRGQAPFGQDIGTPGAFLRRMPADMPPVPDDKIAFIEDWINDGCPEVDTTPADPAPDAGGDCQITIATNSGGPLIDPQLHLDYWRDFDNWAMFEAIPEMQRDISTVMSVVPSWFAYALDASLEAQWEGVSVGSSMVLDPTLRIADRHIETLAKHYGNPVPLLTVLDSYERFGADTLPDDAARPADVRHNMNGPTMWFFWAAFADTCLRHGAQGGWNPHFQEIVRGHTRALLLGMMNDGVFRGRFQVPGFMPDDAGREAMLQHVRTLPDDALIDELRKRYAESGLASPAPDPAPAPAPPCPAPNPGGPPTPGIGKKVYRIHPAIGLARVGNSTASGDDGWYLGQEVPDWRFVPKPNGNYRDNDNRIRREGTRFRVYEYTYPDNGGSPPTSVREITNQEAEITWHVHMANLKSFTRDNLDRQPVPNDPGDKTISGANVATDVVGSIFGDSVQLGTLRTDEAGRLIVLGGFGRSGSPNNNPIMGLFSAGWFDDVADGPVRASIRFRNSGVEPNVTPAWVVTGVPAYATPVVNIVTMYDLALDTAVRKFQFSTPGRVSFTRDIYPILARTAFMQWASATARFGHGPGRGGNFFDPQMFGALSSSSANSAGARQAVFVRIRNPSGGGGNMPQLNLSLSLTPHQYALCEKWRDGQFAADWPSGRAPDDPPLVTPFSQLPAALQPAALDEAGLAGGVGGSFGPGIEVGERFEADATFDKPFRIDPDHGPGYLTETLSIPWQVDFTACGTGWWPGGRPNVVSADGSTFHDWVPGFGFDEMISSWWKLGFLKQEKLNGRTVIVEKETV